jgi:putative membrane protein
MANPLGFRKRPAYRFRTGSRPNTGWLGKLNGAAFDAAYIQTQVQDHQKTITLVMHQIGSGQDRALRSFAADTLPKIRQHLQMAQSIALATTPKVPQAATAPATSPRAPPATKAIGPSAAPQTPAAQKPSGGR